MEKVLSWDEIEQEINNIIEKVRNDNFDSIERAKEIMEVYFSEKKFTDEELEKAKLFVRRLSEEINNKITEYDYQLSQDKNKAAGFNKYFNTLNLDNEE